MAQSDRVELTERQVMMSMGTDCDQWIGGQLDQLTMVHQLFLLLDVLDRSLPEQSHEPGLLGRLHTLDHRD
jgi:hypothetical protein